MNIILTEYSSNGKEIKTDVTDSITSISIDTNEKCKIAPEIFDMLFSIIKRNQAKLNN